jgi:outer membrane protein TolC
MALQPEKAEWAERGLIGGPLRSEVYLKALSRTGDEKSGDKVKSSSWFLVSGALFVAFNPAGVYSQTLRPAIASKSQQLETLTFEQCLERALKTNRTRKISQFEVELAEAQHREALSGYWPQISAKAGVQRSDQPINLLFPSLEVPVPAEHIPVAGGAALVTIPANAFGPGFPPSNVSLPVSYPGQIINTPAQNLGVSAQNIKLLDRDLASGRLDVTYLLYDGGMRRGLREQSAAGVDAMLAESKRTDLAVADSVCRMYWSAVMAHQLR